MCVFVCVCVCVCVCVVRCGAVRCGAVRCGAVRCGAVRCGAVRCGAVRCGAVWCMVYGVCSVIIIHIADCSVDNWVSSWLILVSLNRDAFGEICEY